MMFNLICTAVLWFLPGLHSIGITSHIDIAERTREHFEIISQGVDYNQLLTRHEDAFQAGAPYPDAFYPSFCFGGDYHDVSEDTHWTPFINATVTYIRDVYPKPWDRDTEKLVVFLLSVVTHQVADVNWHSLGIDQGFIATMSKVNYHGSFQSAHNDADFGGDVLNLFGIDMSYIGKLAKWYVPTDDLLNIYEVLYNGETRITREVIDNCTTLLFLGRLGENIGVVDKLYPIYARRSPFLTDRLQDYYLGGMDDMSVWSQNVWRHTVDMLDYGTHVCDLDHNPIYITCNTIRKMKHAFARYNEAVVNHPVRLASETKLHQEFSEKVSEVLEGTGILLTEDDIKVKPSKRGVKLSPRRKTMKKIQTRVNAIIKDLANEKAYSEEFEENRTIKEPGYIYTTMNEYSRMGESVTSGDINNDGFPDLIIGAPGYSSMNNIQQGRVYVVYGTEAGIPMANLTVEEDADVIFTGSDLHPNGRFGQALAVLDINSDGKNDLAISAPSEGSNRLDYTGSIYIYFGGDGSISESPNTTIRCTQRYCNLGWSLTTGDLNIDGLADLVIGSPYAPAGGEQRGFVGVFYAKQAVESDLTEQDFDWIHNGTQDYTWFGYSTEVSLQQNSSFHLIVGAPTFRLCVNQDCSYNEDDIQSVGQVHIFDAPLTTLASHTITGTLEFQQLGFTLHSGSFGDEDYLFITSITEDVWVDGDNATQGGVVELYAWSDIMAGQYNSTIQFVGDRPYSRFGFICETVDIDKDSKNELIITAAVRSDSFLDYQESGRAFIFRANDTSSGMVTVDDAYEWLGVDTNRVRFGYGSSIIPFQTDTFAVFGIPHLSEGARLGGGLAVYKF